MQDQNNKDKDGKDGAKRQAVTGLSWTHAVGTAKAALPMSVSGGHTAARYASAFAAGIVVGVLVMWGYGASSMPRTIAGQNAVATNNQAAGVVLGQDGSAQSSFEVLSPQQAGKKVTISRAIVTKPTWIVVYESNNGNPGRALGASLFTAKKTSGAVTLLRSTVAGKTYLVGQAADNGNGTFSLTTDKPVMLGDNRLLISISVQ